MSRLREIRLLRGVSRNATSNMGEIERARQVLVDDHIPWLLEKLKLARRALREIQHAYGAPEDEDLTTSTAREALAALDEVSP
jgi:hypothetical protein